VTSDQSDQAGNYVAGVIKSMAGDYDERHKPEAVNRWQEWTDQIVEPLHSEGLAGQIRIPVRLEQRGLVTSTEVALNFFGDIADVRLAAKTANQASRIASSRRPSGTIINPNHTGKTYQIARDLGVLRIDEEVVPRGLRSFGKPLLQPSATEYEYVDPDELADAANKKLQAAQEAAVVEGVEFSIKGRNYSETERLAKGAVIDPDHSTTPSRKSELSKLNPYRNFLARDINWPIVLMADRLGLPMDTKKDRTTPVIEKLIRLAVRQDVAKVRRQHKLAHNVLQLVTNSDYYRTVAR
jgi:hypothetical protein